ncbi:TVP38/TMEM64 family protein [Pelagibius sp. 7325]|uniref:TVP38/TMEM64 family protein n=1 Tax=Pelagibius sp. 7325 TaxID=3131994 RepID=UPI0030ECA525
MSELSEEIDVKPAGRPLLRRLLPLLVLAAAVALAFALGLQDYVSLENLRTHRAELNAFVAEQGVIAALVFIAVYAVTTLLILPVGAVLTIIGGFLFGATLATIYVMLGATLGATILFTIARSALGDLFRAKAGPALERMEAGFRENEFSYMLLLRLVPLFPFFIVNVAPAFLGVSLRTYVVCTFVGIVPGTLVFALAGGGLGSVFDGGGAFTVESVLTPQIIAGLVGLSLLSLLPVAYKHLKARRQAR